MNNFCKNLLAKQEKNLPAAMFTVLQKKILEVSRVSSSAHT